MIKIISLLKNYWYVLVLFIIIVVAWFWWKKKGKIEPVDKDGDARDILAEKGIIETGAQNVYKALAAQIADALGTAYEYYDPRHWTEDDEKVYNLLYPLKLHEFEIVSDLYFKSYAKGRSLSTDLANMLDKKLYSILKVK